MGEDVGRRGGVYSWQPKVCLEEFGENRVVDTPLAEASIVGMALGAAYRGMRPIPEIQFSDFVWPAANQLDRRSCPRFATAPTARLQAPLVVRIPYGGGIRGGLFHSQNVESFFFHTPGLKVVTPATPYDCQGAAQVVNPRQQPGSIP